MRIPNSGVHSLYVSPNNPTKEVTTVKEVVRKITTYVATAVMILAIAGIVGYFAYQMLAPKPIAAPERVLPPPADTTPSSQEKGGGPVKPKKLPKVAASDIVTVAIPAIGVDVRASGSIMPVKSERCKDDGVDMCMDPPLLDQVAWSGGYSTPSSPAKGAVLVYGHSNPYSEENQTFNDLGALVADDRVTVVTKTGRFTYVVTKVEVIPFEDIPWHKPLYRDTPGKLSLIACNLTGEGGYDGNVVVTTKMVNAKPVR